VWIDETYVEYVGRDQSLEAIAARSENLVVCKSMSKVYALSGMRAAYLCAAPHQLEALRLITPPWSVGLPAQIAATRALQAESYYQARYQETHWLREELADGLRVLGIAEIIPGVANFLLFHLPTEMAPAEDVIEACQRHGLYLRDASGMGSALGDRALRIAVKDRETNRRMLAILGAVLRHTMRPVTPVECQETAQSCLS
jgi:histidinol-phosphate/aromatic aminotransferase/cobyric acid decarboxylase-like protein